MKFWLKKSGSEKFSGPVTIGELRSGMQSGEINADWEALEAASQSLRELRESHAWVRLGALFTPEGVFMPPSGSLPPETLPSPAALLQDVRRRTCYPGLRNMIGLFSMLGCAGLVILAGISAFTAGRIAGPVPAFAALISAGLWCILVLAAGQAALLLVDIADALIGQTRHDVSRPAVP